MRRALRAARRATLVVVLGAGLVGVVRQRRAARDAASHRLTRLGPAGGSVEEGTAVTDDDRSLHGRLSRWHPVGPRTVAGRILAAAWAAPLSALGVTAALAGGALPRWDRSRACLVAVGVGGPMGAFLAGNGADAATLGAVVMARSATPSAALLDHEAQHTRQQERLGPLFAVAYPLAQACWGYRRNPFEVAARAATARLSEPAGSA